MKRTGECKYLKGLFCLLFAWLLFMPARASAGVVQPTGSGYRDYKNIMAELKKTGTVILKSGCTYYLSKKIHPRNGWSIIATGAKIVANRDVISNKVTATNYNSLNGFSITGGTWVSTLSKGVRHSFIKLTHAQNIRLSDMTIKAANIGYHSIELVACKNAVVSGCTIRGKGTPSSSSVEEGIQIDVCTPSTAPYVDNPGKFCNGAGCKNITIENCRVTGGRGICANFLNPGGSRNRKYKKPKNFHKNITIRNCRITGLTSEGLALFNTLNAEVSNNIIKSSSKRIGMLYSVGCHFAILYPASEMAMSKGNITISNNTIYGGRAGLNVDAHDASYGKVTIYNNRLFSRTGKKQALNTRLVRTLVTSGNLTNKW